MSDRGAPLAVVTGAARGIGEEVARQLADRGYQLVLIGRSDSVLATARRLADTGADAEGFIADVADAEAVQRVYDSIALRAGRIDALVNNAGVHSAIVASQVDRAELDRVLEVNLVGTWTATRVFLPLLLASPNGRIVNVSSGAAQLDSDDDGLRASGGREAAYAVSKAAVNAMTVAFAAELAETPVIVNAICPGFTASRAEYAELGARPLPDGAASIVWGVTLPDDGPRGGFFRDGRPLSW